MADPKLVAYLRRNLGKFGAESLRSHLLGEGVSTDEFEEALAVAARPAAGRPPVAVYLVLAGVAVSACAAFLLLDRAVPSKKGDAGDAAPSSPAAGAPTSRGPGAPFIGRYGYMLQLPAGYKTTTEYRDIGQTTEVVYMYPEKVDPTNAGNEGLYGQLGILRLEVSPRRMPEGTVGFETMKAGVVGTLARRGDTYKTRETKVGGLAALQVNITQPVPLAQTFIIGNRVLYVLTGGVEDKLYTDLLQGLHEVSPHGGAPPR